VDPPSALWFGSADPEGARNLSEEEVKMKKITRTALLLLCLSILALAPAALAADGTTEAQAAPEQGAPVPSATSTEAISVDEPAPAEVTLEMLIGGTVSIFPECNQGAYCTTDADCGFTGYCSRPYGPGGHGCCNCF
jgi:hypothetical protein